MPPDTLEKPLPHDTAARAAAACLTESFSRVLPADVERRLVNRHGLSRRQARAAIRRLVQAGEWVYTYEHGCSFLEPSFGRPVPVGERIVLVPAGQTYQGRDREVTICLATGASFGSGRHPSTRLAIRGVEQALLLLPRPNENANTAVLDIGTGSGVLVIAAAKLGIAGGIGIDTDPCARAEARHNVRLNRLADRIDVLDQSIHEIKPTGRFFIVVANLRLPTLLHLAPSLCLLTAADGRLVLSGIRSEEMGRLQNAYRSHRFGARWKAQEKGWGVVVLQKGPQ